MVVSCMTIPGRVYRISQREMWFTALDFVEGPVPSEGSECVSFHPHVWAQSTSVLFLRRPRLVLRPLPLHSTLPHHERVQCVLCNRGHLANRPSRKSPTRCSSWQRWGLRLSTRVHDGLLQLQLMILGETCCERSLS